MIKVGISIGDINGIGPEVILKTFQEHSMTEICTPVIFGSQKLLSAHRRVLNLEDIHFHFIKDASQAHPGKINLINVWEEEVNVEIGKQLPLGGQYAFKSLKATCDALKDKKIDVLVTAPIDKHNIQSDEFKFAGHTEYLDQQFGGGGNSLMLMVADSLRVGVVTGHVPVSAIAQSISIDKILNKIIVLNRSLREDFGIRKPKIAVMGLNPHAGDNGTIGKEETEIIIPAINKAKEMNILAYGPYSADGFFGSGAHQQFDGILAMYHDQGLVPFKALSFNSGVNFTTGLSIVRTSPDHGVAYDIAGQNKASEESFRKAIYTAIDVFKKRSEYRQINADPLPMNAMKKERRDN